MKIQIIKPLLIGLLSLTLVACLSFGSLSHKQVKFLKQQGFVLTDEGWSLGLPERLLFEFNASDISDQNLAALEKLAAQLQHYKLNKLRIVGHSDNIGDATYNLKLSEQRARSVANVFIEHHFDAKNIQIIGKGASQPLNTQNSDQARAENRRVAVIIIP